MISNIEISKLIKTPLFVLFAAVLIVSLFVLFVALNARVGDIHYFRQAQTAISTYWMVHGGPWFDYETPVLGYPWSLPFEFPLYNWIVALLNLGLGIPLDAAGRLVSYIWLILCLIPATYLIRSYDLPKPASLLFCVFLLASPQYLFWGRTFMMETQAVFFSCAFLACVRDFEVKGRYRALVLVALFGTAAALTKITTLYAFYFLAGLMVLFDIGRRFLDRRPYALRLVAYGVAMLIPVILFELWDRHADALKSTNDIAAVLRSTTPKILLWNFGTLQQRFSFTLLHILVRASIDLLGWLSPVILIATITLVLKRGFLDRKTKMLVAALAAAYFLMWFTFTNLLIVHNYYSTANGLFIVAAVAIVVAQLMERWGSRAGFAVAVVIVLSQYARFASHYAPVMITQSDTAGEMAIAQYLKASTPRDSVVAIYGKEWSPFIAYYAQRRALMEPDWTPVADYRRRLLLLSHPVGGLPISAVVHCSGRIDNDPVAVGVFARLARSDNVASIAGCTIYSVKQRR